MKRIIPVIISSFIAFSFISSLTANAGTPITGTDFGYYPVENDGETFYRLYCDTKNFLDVGYIYIMENTDDKPNVGNAELLSEICSDLDVPDNGKISVGLDALVRYGDVYFSTELAESRAGVSKIIELEMKSYSNCYLRPEYHVTLDYTSLEAFEAESDAVLEELYSLLPQDEFGYCYPANYPKAYMADGNVVLYIGYAGMGNDKADTEVSEIFKNASPDYYYYGYTTPGSWDDFIETGKSLYNMEKVLDVGYGYIDEDLAIMPDITSQVRDKTQLSYTVVYSSAPTNGDYNNDGLLEISDAQNLLAYSAAHVAGTTESLPIVSSAPENMDVDGDGEITIADAQYVLTYCAQQAAGLNPTWDGILK